KSVGGQCLVKYAQTAYRHQGDCNLLVEFADDADVKHSFRVLELDAAVRKEAIEGVIETLPMARSLNITFNPREIASGALALRLKKIEAEMGELDSLPSRYVKLPVWYNDPWSIECAKAHWDLWDHDYGGGCQSNIEYVSKLNNTTIEAIIQRICSVDFWNTGVGFIPGTMLAVPLKPDYVMIAPTYRKPRMWTHDRILNIAGKQITIYTSVSPGGYQLIGRTPWNVYEPTQKNLIFKHSPILSRPGDRYRFYQISENEYWRIRRRVEEGTCDYEANIREEVFDVRGYLEKLTTGPSKAK
ncbi:MAG: allophanate hydrolase subunit 1, partial [Candidatus Bathyarchaeia archaeon]